MSFARVRRGRPTAVRALLAAAALAVLSSTGAGSALAASPSPSPSGSASATAKAPAQALTYGIKPFQPDGATPRGAFQYTLAPGQTARDAASLYNFATTPLTFRLLASDGYTNSDGDFALLDSNEKSRDAGTWVRFQLPKNTVLRIPARSRVDVPVVFAVPKTATPGDHYAGVVMSLPATARDNNGNIIRVDSRVSTQVAIRVAGALQPALTVENLGAGYDGRLSPLAKGSVTVTYTVRNAGNIAQEGRQRIVLTGPFGLGEQVRDLDLPRILPGSAVDVAVPFGEAWPMVRYTAEVTVDPSSRPGDPVAAVTTTAVSFWAIPWPQLAALLLISLIVFYAVRRSRSRSSPPPGAPIGAPVTPEVPVP